jgi:hypothetical protein
MNTTDNFIKYLEELAPELGIYKKEILETANPPFFLNCNSTAKSIAVFVDTVFNNVDFVKIDPDETVLHVALLSIHLSNFLKHE